MGIILAHGAAPKALLLVSERIAEKVFVITATNKLISQKLRTMTQMMKKKQETKNSASIIEYMRGDHCQTIAQQSSRAVWHARYVRHWQKL